MSAHTSHSGIWEAEAGGPQAQGQHGLCSKFKSSLGYMWRRLQKQKKIYENRKWGREGRDKIKINKGQKGDVRKFQ